MKDLVKEQIVILSDVGDVKQASHQSYMQSMPCHIAGISHDLRASQYPNPFAGKCVYVPSL